MNRGEAPGDLFAGQIAAGSVPCCIRFNRRQTVRRACLVFLVAVISICGGLGWTQAAEFAAKLERPPAGVSRAQFELWVPDSLGPRRARAVIATSDYEGGRMVFDDAVWKQFAENSHCVMLRFVLERPEPQLRLAKGGSAAAGLEAGLEELARLATRPEVVRIPWILTGLSQSAWQAHSIANERPGRTLAVVAWHAATSARAPEVYLAPQGRGIPMLHLMAGLERFPIAMESFIRDACSLGALWTYQLQVGVPHQKLGESAYPVIWLTSVLSLRLAKDGTLQDLQPDQGWRGSLEAYESVPGDRRVAKIEIRPPTKRREIESVSESRPGSSFWLPDETSARAWLGAHPIEQPPPRWAR